jgi:hypothetical protein
MRRKWIDIQIVLILISFNTIALSQNNSKTEKYWNTLEFHFNGFYCTEQRGANATDLLKIQNVDQLDLTFKTFDGYAFGTGLFVRPSKYFDVLFDINYNRTKSFIAHEGDRLTGPDLVYDWVMNGSGEIPPAPNDLYYGAKTFYAKLGGRFIIPVKRSIEPWIGFGYGLLTYEIAIGNKKLSRAYTDIVTGSATAPTLMAGVDFNLFEPSLGDKKQLGASIFIEFGRSDISTDYSNFLWEGYEYHIESTPALMAFRFGLALHMPLGGKKANNASKT